MARELVNDFYQAFRFAVVMGSPGDLYIEASAGFNNITVPEVSQEAAEYREGNRVWTVKQPGPPTVGNATFQQGVSNANGNGRPFYNWLLAAAGGWEFRSDIEIVHQHRARGDIDSRVITLGNAWPSRVKVDGDFDATSAEISLREMDVECEWVQVDAQAITTPGQYNGTDWIGETWPLGSSPTP